MELFASWGMLYHCKIIYIGMFETQPSGFLVIAKKLSCTTEITGYYARR